MNPKIAEAIRLIRERIDEVRPPSSDIPSQEAFHAFRLSKAVEQLQLAEEGEE